MILNAFIRIKENRLKEWPEGTELNFYGKCPDLFTARHVFVINRMLLVIRLTFSQIVQYQYIIISISNSFTGINRITENICLHVLTILVSIWCRNSHTTSTSMLRTTKSNILNRMAGILLNNMTSWRNFRNDEID